MFLNSILFLIVLSFLGKLNNATLFVPMIPPDALINPLINLPFNYPLLNQHLNLQRNKTNANKNYANANYGNPINANKNYANQGSLSQSAKQELKDLVEERFMQMSDEQKEQLHFQAFRLAANYPLMTTFDKMVKIRDKFDELYGPPKWYFYIYTGSVTRGDLEEMSSCYNRFGFESQEVLFLRAKDCPASSIQVVGDDIAATAHSDPQIVLPPKVFTATYKAKRR